MKDEALESVFSAIFMNFEDESEFSASVKTRFSEVFHVKDKLPQLIEKCKNLATFQLEVFVGNHPIHVYIIKPETCWEQTLKPGIINKIDLGKSLEVSLKFSLKPAENAEKIKRSASLLKKVGFFDEKKKKSSESFLQVSSLPIGSKCKKNIHLGGGKTTVFDLKLVKNDNRHLVQPLDFEDFLEITQKIHEWQASSSSSNSSQKYDGNLGNPTFSMFYSMAFFFEIPSFILKVCEMITFLVWDDEDSSIQIDDRALFDVIEKMTACEIEVDLHHPLLVPSLIYLNDCTSTEIRNILEKFANEPLFPPISHHRLKPINDSLKIVGEICILEIWDDFADLTSPASCLSIELSKLLVESAKRFENTVKYAGFLELYTKLHNLWARLNEESKSYQIFFNQFDINYIKTSVKALENTIKKSVCRVLKEEIRSINTRNHEELEEFTNTSMRLFLILKNISKISGFLNDFEEWFQNIAVFWTYSWRDITRKMVERTISLDEDGDSVKYGARRPLPAGLYSFLCIQKGIADDMMRLELRFERNLIVCSTAVVNILCQNNIAYAKKLFNEAIRNHDEKSWRIIRATNGIEQALNFVEEGFERFAEFDRLEKNVEIVDFDAVRLTSQRLLKTTREMCEKMQIEKLLQAFVELKIDIISRIARNLCTDLDQLKGYYNTREVTINEKIEGTLECCYGLVDDVKGLLLPNCFKISTKFLASSLETEVRKFLKQKQTADYYSNIYIALKYIYEMLEIENEKDIDLLKNLHLNSFSTNDLILSYYDSICEKIERSTNFGNVPNIDIQIQHSKIEPKNADDQMEIAIQIKLVKMSPMEWIDILSDRVDYFTKFELLPKVLFPSNKFDSPMTNPVPQSTTPQWKELFEIRVPLDSFFTRGACLSISVFDHELQADRLIGRGFIPLHSVPSTTSTLRIPLLSADFQADNNSDNPFFQLLKARSSRDPIAREFIETRTKRIFRRISDIHRMMICRRRNWNRNFK